MGNLFIGIIIGILISLITVYSMGLYQNLKKKKQTGKSSTDLQKIELAVAQLKILKKLKKQKKAVQKNRKRKG